MLSKNGMNFQEINVAYQSKIGPIKWLEPNLQDTLKKYKNKRILIYPIAFTMDNSETDFELSILYKQEAQSLGVSDFRVAKCLNEKESFAKMILMLSKEILQKETL